MQLHVDLLAYGCAPQRVADDGRADRVYDGQRNLDSAARHTRMDRSDNHTGRLLTMLGAIGMCIGGQTGDRYELLRPLGQGSFGDAWAAHDRDEDTVVAVKLLDPHTDPDDVLREAKLHRRLSEHPRVVSMRNVELGANPSSFVVSELIAGGSLDRVLSARRPTVVETHRWLRDVLEALAHAHRLQVLHRDVKPSNLLLGPDGHAQLTDFGVSEDSVRRAAMTPGMYPLTLPPEFAAGAPTDERTDLWLVGMLGWQLLVGRRPDLAAAHAGTVELAHRHSLEVPLAFSRTIAAAMDPDPNGRPSSAARMHDELMKASPAAGWHDVAPSRGVVRAWRADAAGGHVEVAIHTHRRGGYLVAGRAPQGSRLSARREARVFTEAAARKTARDWLLHVVAGRRL
jgi:hypothetical protein